MNINDYEMKINIVNGFIILAIVLIVINLFFVFFGIPSIKQSQEYIRYEKIKAEYNKELAVNKDLVAARQEALKKLKFAQDTWNERQRRFS